jgi:hypothetical protein
MTTNVDTLYALLPAFVRARDQEAGRPLYGLLAVLAEQGQVLEDNLAQSYADLFIDTCADWVVPYIGDLVGTTPLFDSSRVAIDTSAPVYQFLAGPTFAMAETLRSRVDVANTLRYRRTKATRPMLEGLSHDVTGWPTYALEMRERLRWTQCVRNHVRTDSLGTPDLRSANALDRIDGPFDTTSRAVDVRTPTQSQGWYQIPNIGFFVWRLQGFRLANVAARSVSGAGDWRYHFSPLGNPTPLFANYDPNAIGTAPPSEQNLPAAIRWFALRADLDAYRATASTQGFTAYYGRMSGDAPSPTMPIDADAAFTIVRDGVTVPPEQIRCTHLGTWCQPQGNVVGVDPVLGRIAFGTTFAPTKSVDVYFHYGFSAGIGGGTYARAAWLLERTPDVFVIPVDSTGAKGATSIAAALGSWNQTTHPNAVLSILDSRTYHETLNLTLAAGARLTIEAVDGARPHVLLSAPMTIAGAANASVTLSGLLIEGAIDVTGALGTLRLLHTTLVPGVWLSPTGAPGTTTASIIVATTAGGHAINSTLDVQIAASITGPLAIPAGIHGLYVTDSIVDGIGGVAIGSGDATQFAPATTLVRTTVLGTTFAQSTNATETIFGGALTAQRRQIGCVRFSYVPPLSSAPRKYRCQPDLEIATEIQTATEQAGQPIPSTQSNAIRSAVSAWLVPTFTSSHYGDPGYGQLAAGGVSQIATGAEDGSEMGVFAQLKQPQRAQNLRTRLGEYLPVGLDGTLIDVT